MGSFVFHEAAFSGHVLDSQPGPTFRSVDSYFQVSKSRSRKPIKLSAYLCIYNHCYIYYKKNLMVKRRKKVYNCHFFVQSNKNIRKLLFFYHLPITCEFQPNFVLFFYRSFYQNSFLSCRRLLHLFTNQNKTKTQQPKRLGDRQDQIPILTAYLY